MNNPNEETLINKILNHQSKTNQVIDYIKEHFNCNAEYNEENNKIEIITESDNALNISLAKKYIIDSLGEDMIETEFV